MISYLFKKKITTLLSVVKNTHYAKEHQYYALYPISTNMDVRVVYESTACLNATQKTGFCRLF